MSNAFRLVDAAGLPLSSEPEPHKSDMGVVSQQEQACDSAFQRLQSELLDLATLLDRLGTGEAALAAESARKVTTTVNEAMTLLSDVMKHKNNLLVQLGETATKAASVIKTQEALINRLKIDNQRH